MTLAESDVKGAFVRRILTDISDEFCSVRGIRFWTMQEMCEVGAPSPIRRRGDINTTLVQLDLTQMGVNESAA